MVRYISGKHDVLETGFSLSASLGRTDTGRPNIELVSLSGE
jgi:hypothetical protein